MQRLLWLDGQETDVAVDLRRRFFGRLRGLLGRRPLDSSACVWLERCAVVHTFGMRFALDLAFVSRHGVVLHVEEGVPAWRIRWLHGARAVVEADAGTWRKCGVRPGARLAHGPGAAGLASAVQRQRGSATLEFVAAAVLVLLPLVGAIFEGAQLAISRQLLTVAAVEAARVGAVTHGDRGAMQRRLARGLVPLFGAPAPGTDEGTALRAYGQAWIEVQRPDLTQLRIERPTAESFADFGIAAGSDLQIPNDGDALLQTRGAVSGLTLAQSNILAIRIRYCRRLIVPGLDALITTALRGSRFSADPFDRLCLARQRVPIEVRAAVHMQSAARAAALGIAR